MGMGFGHFEEKPGKKLLLDGSVYGRISVTHTRRRRGILDPLVELFKVSGPYSHHIIPRPKYPLDLPFDAQVSTFVLGGGLADLFP